MSYKTMNAPDLVKHWKKTVNDNVQMGRDAHMMKTLLEHCTPVQILCGMYQYTDSRTITIPQFIRQADAWLLEDEFEAGLHLAIAVSHADPPPAYYIMYDLEFEETADAHNAYENAKEELKIWADRILS